ncbi:MAG: DNA polymerase, partial [Pseudomonadota bacterium]
LRILAHLSNDKNMIESFEKNEDIHTRTASEIFDVPIELVTMTQRREAKAVNFGIMYGKTPFGLARELGISNHTASEIIKRYFEKYKSVAEIRQGLIEKARNNGFTETMFGRRRYIPDINSKKPAIRGFAERNAINSPIQGTASDIIKLATVRVWNMLKSKFPDVKLILNVHDELVAEAPEKDVQKAADAIKKEMESVMDITPQLAVDVRTGENWLEAHT